jgi:hypothetical protein
MAGLKMATHVLRAQRNAEDHHLLQQAATRSCCHFDMCVRRLSCGAGQLLVQEAHAKASKKKKKKTA